MIVGPDGTDRARRVALSVDVACFAVREGDLLLLLMQRRDEPFAGQWALPGALVGVDEGLDAAAQRVLAERTGLTGAYLEQLYTFGDPGRDPRGRTVSVAHYALLPLGEHPVRPGRGAEAVAWWPARRLPPLAFDHGRIAAYAAWRLAQKLEYAPLAFRVLPETFTMGDLRTLYEAVQGRRLHPSNFTDQMLRRWDHLTPVPGVRETGGRGRPARRYRYTGPAEIPGPPGDVPATAETAP
jgi:8-oxo-dGTP diphosphatase